MGYSKMNDELRKKFLTDTDETGRFLITSSRTGKTYAVEPMGWNRVKWGSIDPATKELVNKKGHQKYTGSIKPEDSLITEENGFKNVKILEPGVSPIKAIEAIDAQYPDKEQDAQD
jgi:hypothetical protein